MRKPDVEVRLLNPEPLVARLKIVAEWLTRTPQASTAPAYVFADAGGKLRATTYGRNGITAFDRYVLVAVIWYRRKTKTFELEPWPASTLADEIIDVFAELGHRCVIDDLPPEDTK